MDDKNHQSAHRHFAARLPAGSDYAVTVAKNGCRHLRRLPNGEEKEYLSIGLACSECFSGPTLHKVLKPGMDFELQVMQDLLAGDYAAPLSIHTSNGVSEKLEQFVEALEMHLPWKNKDELDWCVSLQLEGASAVWAAIDMCLQTSMLKTGDKNRIKVAVGASSYHGPPSTCFGARCPLWTKHYQVKYPSPAPGKPIDEEAQISAFTAFLDEHADTIGVMLMEPQLGSSQAAYVWPRSLLKRYISLAQERGIMVICDEIMCGMGRHGTGTLFISESWDLNPDAVTFGKAIGAGVYPISGAILKQGRDLLGANKCSVMQSHTYAGSSTRSLSAATEVLKELPAWLPSIAKLGGEFDRIFKHLGKLSKGMFICHGQGMMWGGVISKAGKNADDEFRNRVKTAFPLHCEESGVLPYIVPVGGFMVSPVYDLDVATVHEIGVRLEKAIRLTMKTVGWEQENIPAPVVTGTYDKANKGEKASNKVHVARTTTSGAFVPGEVRTYFLKS